MPATTILEAKTEEWNIDELEPIDLPQPDGEEGEPGEEGEGEDEGEDEEGDGDGEGEGEPSDKKGKGKGKPGSKGEDKGEDKGDEGEGEGDEEENDPNAKKAEGKSAEDIDAAHKKIADKMNEKDDKGNKEIDDERKADTEKRKRQAPQQGKFGKDNNPGEFDYSKEKPEYTWEELLKKLVTDAAKETEETYLKPNPKNITGAHIARQTGAGYLKPGEISIEGQIKLCFIIDSSGSMSGDIAKVYANLDNLIKQHSDILNCDFYLIKFSNDHHIYKCNLTSNNYVEMTSLDNDATKDKGGDLEKLFKQHFGASTEFNAALARDAQKLIDDKYNVIVITDTDILAAENMKNLKSIYAKANDQLYIIAADKDVYTALIKALGEISRNITHL